MSNFIYEDIFPIANLPDIVSKHIENIFKFPFINIKEKLDCYIQPLKTEIYCYFEFPYVDKFYRDSYYFFFSSKHKEYKRDCIRISLFENKITKHDFRSLDKINNLQKIYLGYMVLRPTYPRIIGTTKISPRALIKPNFICCLAKSISTINGAKLSICAFPYASQDGETLTCAETSLWNVIEYFSNKYPDYKTILPSQIASLQTNMSYERLIPSTGLTVQIISFILREQGFGSKVYSRKAYNDKNEFRQILNHYIESGIPVIVGINNKKGVYHAITYIGHETISKSDILSSKKTIKIKTQNGPLKIIESYNLIKKYVIIDDNCPPYQLGRFDNPAEYYQQTALKYEIAHFIVPLYKRIYLESWQAYKFILLILKNNIIGFNIPKGGIEIIIRFYLTSSRSFKYKTAIDMDMDSRLKEIIIATNMPKFIWVAELSNKQLYANDLADGLIIIDATNNDMMQVNESFIFISYPDKFVALDNEKKVEKVINNIIFKPFSIYTHNLIGGATQWQI